MRVFSIGSDGEFTEYEQLPFKESPMDWNQSTMYEQRVRFILEVQQRTFSFAESCRRYSINELLERRASLAFPNSPLALALACARACLGRGELQQLDTAMRKCLGSTIALS